MSKTKKEFDFGNVSLKRAKNSINGNPAFYVDFFPCGWPCMVIGKTASDAGFAYAFNTGYYEGVKVEYHRTATGRVIFDNIEKE